VAQYDVRVDRAEVNFGHRAPSAVVGPGADVVVPPDAPGPLESEAELLVVIGAPARGVDERDAARCILGYTLGNDIGDRGWQSTDSTNWRWKNADTFKPIGPAVATDVDPAGQTICTSIDGAEIDSWSTADMQFHPHELVARLSRYVTLAPGDVIWVGSGSSRQPRLVPGMRVSVSSDGIGTLDNMVVKL
jgi:2-keto-4-pentenoate hydratase/2-oxohepta-3-ene-1,7-dioic acid hydratase in catechol pathway